MKQSLILIACLLALSGLPGCQNDDTITTVPRVGSNAAPGKFPDFLVGTWKSDNFRWVFTFEPDGKISTMTHYVGMIFDVEKKELHESWKEDVDAYFMLGLCQADYDQATGNLNVSVDIDDFVVFFPNGQMRGTFSDRLSGKVSPKELVWQVSWMCYASMEDGGSTDPNTVKPRIDTFRKVIKSDSDKVTK